MARIPRGVFIVVAGITLLRLIVAARVPLTEDETYYFMWSLHPALGYLDHPPMVAWLIAATSWLGHSSFAVRLLFIACEGFAALCIGAAAGELSQDGRAAGAACMTFLLIPQIRFAFGEALPDPPYLAFWALALLLCARLERRVSATESGLLGIALGGALLSRFFGWALLVGIAAWALSAPNRPALRRGVLMAISIALILYVPFLVYDAAHGWQNLAFTLHDRQPLASDHLARAGGIATLRFMFVAAALLVFACFATIRRPYALLAWTAIPFTVALVLLSPFENTETYWLLGPIVSLCVAAGIAFVRWTRVAQLASAVSLYFAFALVAVTSLLTALPEGAQAAILYARNVSHGAMSDGVYMWPRLSSQIAQLDRERRSVALTDAFETDSELAYYGARPLMVGTDLHVRQWRRWNRDDGVPERAIFVRYDHDDTATLALLARAYARESAGPDIPISFAGMQIGTFYTTFYAAPRADAALILWGCTGSGS